jgi:hypothetical protein
MPKLIERVEAGRARAASSSSRGVGPWQYVVVKKMRENTLGRGDTAGALVHCPGRETHNGIKNRRARTPRQCSGARPLG